MELDIEVEPEPLFPFTTTSVKQSVIMARIVNYNTIYEPSFEVPTAWVYEQPRRAMQFFAEEAFAHSLSNIEITLLLRGEPATAEQIHSAEQALHAQNIFFSLFTNMIGRDEFTMGDRKEMAMHIATHAAMSPAHA